MMRKHVCHIIPPKAFCQFAPAANDALYPCWEATQVCLLQKMPVKRLHRQARCVDRLSANGHAAGNSDARNCLFAAPVSSERATEPSGGSTQHDQVRFAFNSLTWEDERNRCRRARNLRVINTSTAAYQLAVSYNNSFI